MSYLEKEKFECEKCGECCKPLVLLTQEDIDRIKNSGFKEKKFLQDDPLDDSETKGKVLRQKDEYCMFCDRKKDGTYHCLIHSLRPETCRKYPFVEEDLKLKSCKPKKIFRNKFNLD